MSLHKLTAGDGYTYLTRQVAAADATERGTASLGDYYTEKGESPGHWMGAGLAGLNTGPGGVDVAAAGDWVSEAQMLALFGEGRHPDASVIEERMIAGGAHPSQALAHTRLGNPYLIFEGSTPYRQAVAERFVAHNVAQGTKGVTPIPEEVRAGIRTKVAQELFAAEYQRPPADERELSGFIARGSRQATTAVAGYDLTFSPVKSVSALWATAPREVAAQVEAAHHAAVADTVGWLETHAAFTRLGAGGVRQVDTRGLIGAAFTHRDSRAGDPDLHTHVAISNKVQTLGQDGQPGRWLALDGRVLHKAAVAASERYNTRLEAQLVARLGVRFADRDTGDTNKRVVREIVGVDPALNTAWSSRRAGIEVRRAVLVSGFQARHGRAPSAVETLALSQQATLETRARKHEPRSHAEQRQQWRTEAVAVLGGERELAGMVHQAVPGTRPQTGVVLTNEWVAATAAAVLVTVSKSRATWQADHVRAEAERAARTAGVDLNTVDEAVDAVVSAALAPGLSVRLDRATDLGADMGVSEPWVLRRADGESVYTVARTQLFTSQAVIDAEARLLTAARRTDGRRITGAAVGMALLESTANGRELNPGQAAMVGELTTSGARVQVALAPAGTGKTTALGVLARAWSEEGGTVLGLAPTAAAAAVLRHDLAAPTDTLDKLVHAITEMRNPANADKAVRVPTWVADIGPQTLVVVDEAGMAATAALDTAVDFVLGCGGSVRLVGDDQQLASVAAGGVVRDIAETCGAVTLSHVVRFADPVEGSASLAIRTGDTAGIGFYLDHHRVHVGDPATVIDGAYQGWATDRDAGLDAVMLAPTRDTVAALNLRARADRLTTQTTAVGREVALREGATASAGDVITTRRNDRRIALTANDWVRNGDRWHIHDVHRDGSLRVRHLGTGRVITLPADYVAAHVDLGYARTIHAAQGLTTDTCHTVATGEESRQLLYVGMTRGRTHNHVYVQTVGDGDPHTQITPQVLRPPTAVDVLTRMVGYDGSQQSATTTARTLTDPTEVLAHAAGAYIDAVGVAAITIIEATALRAIDTAAEQVHPGLTQTPAYPTLRGHLAVLTLTGADPEKVLRTAAVGHELHSATDPAAVLDWRLDPTGRHSADQPGRHSADRAGRHSAEHIQAASTPGPLPWLPGIPAVLVDDPSWGPYLQARHQRVTTTAARVAADAAELTPTTAPGWARALLADTVGDGGALIAEVAVWRAATGVDVDDRRPTGPQAYRVAEQRHQRALDDRVEAVLGDPDGATARWAPLLRTLQPRVLTDPYWPVLADRMVAADRAGIDIGALTVTAAGLRPLPDELPAAALWWRLAEHLAPSVIEAATTSAAQTLRPAWTPALTTILGENLASRVLADPAWPVLVTAVDTATHTGWNAPDLLSTAAELLRAGTTTDNPRVRADEVTTALVWRVEALLDHTDGPDTGTEYLAEPEHHDGDSRDDPAPENSAPTDSHTVLDADLPPAVDGVLDQVDALAAEGADADLLALLDAEPVVDDHEGVTAGQDTIGDVGADWDGALLLELPYTGLAPAEQVTQISTDLQAARDAVASARHQLFTDTTPHLQAAMPMLTAMRNRADALRPLAAADAAAHELWIDAEHAVEAAEHTVASLQRELAATTEGTGAASAEDLGLQLDSAHNVVVYARQEVSARRAEWDTAHSALLTAAGGEGVITASDVDHARLAADALDTGVLTERRDTVRALEGALLRAENHAAHQYAHTESALPTTATQAAGAAASTDTAAQPGLTGTAVMADTPTPGPVRPDTAAPTEPGWRRLLGPRPTAPAQAARWEQTVAVVSLYRSTYHVTTTNPLTPLGAPPPSGSEQAPAYRAVIKQWRTTMASTGTGDNLSAVTARLAEIERRLTHLQEQREARRDRAENTVASQDGITDDHGFGHDTGFNAGQANRRSGMGY